MFNTRCIILNGVLFKYKEMIKLTDAQISLKKNLENFKNIFEKEYTWVAGFMRNVYRYPDK